MRIQTARELWSHSQIDEIANGLLTRIRFQNKPPLHTSTQANTNEKSPVLGFFCSDRDLSSGVKLKKLHSLDL